MKEIIIDKSQDLNLTFEEDTNSNIKIIIKKNIHCNLNTFTNTSSKQNIKIELKKNAKLKHNTITLKTKEVNYNILQHKNSSYKNSSLNFANKTNITTNNSITLKEQNTYSNIKIINITNNSSNIESSGLIHIKEQSSKSEGHQKFEGIILDNNSSIQAQPNLEVKNNDIICSHGASITQIDEKKLFYLNSKGFNKQQSINLIIQGYFDSILSKITPKFSEQIKQKLKQQKII